MFYNQLNLAIEIDESGHEHNIENDKIRQLDIEKNINCNFFRIKINQGDILNQIKTLKEYIKELKIKIDFDAWEEPKFSSLYDLKKEFRNTGFVKMLQPFTSLLLSVIH